MEKHIDKELVMTKEYDEDFKKPAECWICDNVYLEGVATSLKNIENLHIETVISKSN